MKAGSGAVAGGVVNRGESGKLAFETGGRLLIDFYFWSTPNGWKIAIALEEFGLPYRVRPVNIGKGEQHAEAFLEISPNNRIPAIVDHEGPEGAPISVFESGAILQYLARKTGRFYGEGERDRVSVDQWLMWQMGGLGPMAGQAHHFLMYAPAFEPPVVLPYAQDRYRDECRRLYGVLDRRLAEVEYAAGGFYSIADMAIWPWLARWERHEMVLEDVPNVKRYFEQVGAREAVQRGWALSPESATRIDVDRGAQGALFGRR